ncbi:hypothetical protein AAWM_07958 [Aspergillus awamori]|uniref:NAD(P)-binding domain-containing protein n=1 Tax=Aspergillus awamori TaxID=105351 RepID=A0A401L0E4_ASPAW|nr:hypothetical protein AAWM_07958 [Aspergillus awamori]
MQVLLLGGHGKVALQLTPLLLARSWNVTSVIRNAEHENEILALGKGAKGKLSVLLSSLDDIKSDADAKNVLDRVSPDYVVWSAGIAHNTVKTSICTIPPAHLQVQLKSTHHIQRSIHPTVHPSSPKYHFHPINHPISHNPGAGGKGGPARTHAIDEVAAKHFLSASFSHPSVRKFLLVSWIGSRRKQPTWLSDDEWAGLQNVFYNVLPAYAKAKLEADEYMTALAAARKKLVAAGAAQPLQAINLRPGTLTDTPATRKVDLGKTKKGRANVSREDVAIVADALLARDDVEGWLDLLEGEEDVEVAVERVAREGVDAVEGEDVEGMVSRFGL